MLLLTRILSKTHFYAPAVIRFCKYNVCSHARAKKAVPYSQPWIAHHFSDYPLKCWKCNHPFKSDLFCSKCRALQKLPKDLDYFDIIGVDRSFNLDTDLVQKKYRKLQSLLHPDKFEQKSNMEKAISENLSALINKAYSTLANPLERGLYLLQLVNGTAIDESTNTDPTFLVEIMEKNEQVEEASQDENKVLELLKYNRETLELLTRKISEAFQENDLELAKKLLIRMKYYTSIEKRLKKLKQDLGITE